MTFNKDNIWIQVGDKFIFSSNVHSISSICKRSLPPPSTKDADAPAVICLAESLLSATAGFPPCP